MFSHPLRPYDSERGFTLVELLVVIVLLGIVGAATLSVIVTTSRSNTFQDHLRTVMDDGRLSLDRVRKELRGGRRVLEGSDAAHLRWWLDQNQDGVQQESEQINYCVVADSPAATTCLAPGATGKLRLIRWSDADDVNDDGEVDSAADSRMVARTLTTSSVFSGYDGTDINATRVVAIELQLDVRGTTGPNVITMEAEVRLRNVA